MRFSEIFVSKKTEELFRELYPKIQSDRMIRSFKNRKTGLFAGIILVSSIMCIPFFAKDEKLKNVPVSAIDRNGYSEGEKTVRLRAVTENGLDETVTLTVKERAYSAEELAGFSDRLDAKLWTDILGANESAKCVKYDLDLKRKIDGYPFDISWKTDNPSILTQKGTINGKRLNEEEPDDEGVTIGLCATLKYNDYSEDKYSFVTVHKKEVSFTKKVHEDVLSAIVCCDQMSSTGKEQVLPEVANGTKITFYNVSKNRGWAVLFTGITTAFLISALKDKKIKDEAIMRRKQLDADYPAILDQYALYYTAGMNPRAIWYEICSRYEQDLLIRKGRKRYVYEEMLMTKRLMEEGYCELSAYDVFAERVRSVRYRAFISFIKQAVVKGNDDLENVLCAEMEKARTDRPDQVKILAAEAETKLLFPMFLMLLVVLAIVMIPAFIGINT